MKLTKKDLEWAVDQNLLRQEQMDPLWEGLKRRKSETPSFNFINLAYYFGTGLVLVAMGWYLTISRGTLGAVGIFIVALVYALLFLFSANYLWHRKNLKIPGGLLCTLAVCMVPLMVYAFQRMTGLWPTDVKYDQYDMFFHIFKRNFIILELSTILASIIALKFFRFPFLTAPAAYSLWALSMDIASIISGKEAFQLHSHNYITMIFGTLIVIAAYVIDVKRKDDRDFAFWLYLFGSISLFASMASIHKANEWTEFAFACVYILMMLFSVLIQRKTLLIAGVSLILGYVFHVADHFFKNSNAFPLVLSFIGIAIIVLGITLQKNWHDIEASIRSIFPKDWEKFLPQRDE